MASAPVGANEYPVPTLPVVAAVPVIVGAVFMTVTVKDARLAEPPLPSLTEITTPEDVPLLADVGVPVSAPFEVLNAAQVGLLAIE